MHTAYPTQNKIVVPIADYGTAADLVKLATALLPKCTTGPSEHHSLREGKIILLAIVEVPEERSLSEGARQAQKLRLRLSAIPGPREVDVIEVQSVVRVSHLVWQGIVEAVKEHGADILVLGWKGFTTTPEKAYGTTIDEIMKDPPCDVVVVKPAPAHRLFADATHSQAQAQALAQARKVLLPVRGGQYAEFALTVATSLASALPATITVMHSKPEVSREDINDEPYLAFRRLIDGEAAISRIVTMRGDVETTILAEAYDHDVIIIGATARLDQAQSPLGPVFEAISRQIDKSIVIVKTRHPVNLDAYAQAAAENGGLAVSPISSENFSLMVDKWFGENTFHSREFKNVDHLVKLKRKQGLTISLGLPALNEEQTIGRIVATFKSQLMDKHPLLDEIVLIDSGSTDATVEIVASLGVPVHIHQQILPQHGSYRGKGEALWKSLHVLKGDIIVWIDTDISNIHPAFVYGLVGPLLQEPRIKYVKGFYRRPLALGDKLTATGGGRVTELTARPIFNLFFPELSGLIQPLAGEYAGRREVLEQVPFFTGYGVETGLLIDILDKFGLHSIAQVDLLRRVHRNQNLLSLSQMAFAIIQVFVRRLEDRHRLKLLEEVNKSMKLIRDRRDGYFLDLKEIGDHERPPMIAVSEYLESRRVENYDSRGLDNPGSRT